MNNPKTVVKNSSKGRDFWSSGRFHPRTAVQFLRSRLEEPCSSAGNHDWEIKQFRRGFAELEALGSQWYLRDIRDKAGEKIWLCRTEGRIHFLHYFMPLKWLPHVILEHRACLRACCPFGWNKEPSSETQVRQRCWSKVGISSGGATDASRAFKKGWDWNI